MTVPDPTERPTISVEEAGALLGLSRAASYGAAKTGAIPTLRIGRRLLVPTYKFREMLGLADEPGPARHVHDTPIGALDPTLRDAIVAAAEAFLRVMRGGSS